MIRPLLGPVLGIAVLAVAVSGCQLLSTPEPVQMYRFGGGGEPMIVERSAAIDPVTLSLRRVEFPDASGGDRILGVTGAEAAYIAGARWVSPARQLYTETLEDAFADQSEAVRVIGRQEVVDTDMALDLDFRTFEARYDAPGAVPMVVVSARAQLIVFPSRAVAAERTLTASMPAGENRVSAIVAAFDSAIADLNTELVAWTEAQSARAATAGE